MAGRLNWTKAHSKQARVLSWKEKRLDEAASNWIDHQSLGPKRVAKPTDVKPPTEPTKTRRKKKHRRKPSNQTSQPNRQIENGDRQ